MLRKVCKTGQGRLRTRGGGCLAIKLTPLELISSCSPSSKSYWHIGSSLRREGVRVQDTASFQDSANGGQRQEKKNRIVLAMDAGLVGCCVAYEAVASC
jgi:hypothetical protein